MTSRERMYATLEYRNTHDRAPRDMWTLPWTALHEPEALARITRDYPSDFYRVAPTYSATSSVRQGDPHEPGESVDSWGCRFTNIYRGIHGEVKHPIVTDDDWKDVSRVVIPEEWLSFDIAEVNRLVAASDRFTVADNFPRPFEQLQFIRGTENLYMDLLEQPTGFRDFLERMHDFYCRLLTKWAQTDVDCLSFMDDWGAQRSLLISPTLWRELFKPLYRDYIDIAHRYGKKIYMHSDGYTLDILPDLIELGLDFVNAQIFCIGLDKLAPFKGQITFYGEICRQHILTEGSVADVERAVESVFNTLWDNGGCIAQCEFGPAAKPDNVEAVFATWDRLTAGR